MRTRRETNGEMEQQRGIRPIRLNDYAFRLLLSLLDPPLDLDFRIGRIALSTKKKRKQLREAFASHQQISIPEW